MFARAHKAVTDPTRLVVLRSMALLDTPAEIAFDRLTRLASRLANVPVSLVSLVDNDRQFFKSSVGLPEGLRETPLTHSFCQYVVATHEPLIVEDARKVDFLRDNLAIPDLNVIGYLGVPLRTRDHYDLGSFCLIDSQPRIWTQDEVELAQELAALTMQIVETRAELYQYFQTMGEKIDATSARYHNLRITFQDALAALRATLEHNPTPAAISSVIDSARHQFEEVTR